MNNLAWLLATAEQAQFRNAAKAVELARRACELTKYRQPFLLDTLAAAYAAVGRFIVMFPCILHKYIGNPFRSNFDVFTTFVTIG